MKNKSWMMLICCLAPLLLFIVGPALGLNKENSFFIFIPIIILFCFMMGKGGGCCGSHQHKEKENESGDKQKGDQKGCH